MPTLQELGFRTLQDAEARVESIRSQLRDLSAIEEPSDDDVVLQDTLIREHDDLEAATAGPRQRMADLRRIQTVHDEPENIEPTEPAQSPTVFVRSQFDKDPMRDLSRDRLEAGFVKADEMRARSEAVIERDSKRGYLTQEKAETAYTRSQAVGLGASNGGIAKHVLLTSGEEYVAAFRSYLEDPIGTQPGTLLNMSQEGRYRAINLTNASGGYLLPYILDPTIMLTNNASANPFRRVSRIVQTTSNAWQGVNSAGVTAAWIAEATTAADMSPTVGQVQIVPQKAVAWVLGSYEALDDTNFGEQLPGLLSDAKDRLESAAFATGAGTGSNTPYGILTVLTSSQRVAPGATGTAFQPSTGTTGGNRDVLALQAALPPRFRNAPGAAFLGSLQTLNAVRALDIYGGGAFWTNFTTNTPAGLLGQPAYEASDLPTTQTGTSGATGTGSATLVYGDWGQYIIADRVGVSMLYDPMIKGSTNAQLPTGQAGWFMFWRVGSQVSTTSAFKYLTIS
jgi:HK97 family phage major capsid protein